VIVPAIVPADAVLLPMYGRAAEQAHYHYDTNARDAGATCNHNVANQKPY
jgi:hypothetical protein